MDDLLGIFHFQKYHGTGLDLGDPPRLSRGASLVPGNGHDPRRCLHRYLPRLSQCDALHQPGACRAEPLLALPRRPDRRFLSMDRHTARYPSAFAEMEIRPSPLLPHRLGALHFPFLYALLDAALLLHPSDVSSALASGWEISHGDPRSGACFQVPHGLPSLLCSDDSDRHQPRAAYTRRRYRSEIRHFPFHDPLCSLFCPHAVKGADARLPLLAGLPHPSLRDIRLGPLCCSRFQSLHLEGHCRDALRNRKGA